jgi:PAS domain-containing protein
MYSAYWFDLARLYLILLAITGFFYFREKHFREAIIAMSDSLTEERKWKEVINLLPEGILALDSTRNIAYYNRKMQSIFGLDATTKPLDDLNIALNGLYDLVPNSQTKQVLADMMGSRTSGVSTISLFTDHIIYSIFLVITTRT